jgi:hypothetical protein
MISYRKVCLALLLATSVSLLLSPAALAQPADDDPPRAPAQTQLAASPAPQPAATSAGPVLYSAAPAELIGPTGPTKDGPQPASAETPPAPSPAPQPAATDPDDGWHIGITPYLWFAGMHGTAGALGYGAGFRASFADIFKYLNIGLMGTVEPQYKRFSMPFDFMWLKLSDDKGSPFEIGPTSIKVKVTQTLLTPKVAYRLVDQEKVKVDGTFGIRYWHMGTSLTFEPPGMLNNPSQSVNWVDVVAGARFQVPLSPKVMVTVLGDAGGGGANLDYQVGGFLGYKLKKNLILQAGYRYLDVNYRPSSSFVYDTATSGVLLGVTFYVK